MQYQDRSTSETRWGGAANHYPTLSTEDLCEFSLDLGKGRKRVGDIADDDSLLFLWATAPMLPEALKVLEAWGFAYKTVAFTWIKRNENVTPVMGMGNWTRQNAEFCLLGIRGSGVTRKDKSVMSIIETSRLRHSEKPEEARERIVKLCGDVPKIELFSRQQVEGWDYFGNEVG